MTGPDPEITPDLAEPAQGESEAREACPLWRLHAPHYWTFGGPLKACPGVADEPEEEPRA